MKKLFFLFTLTILVMGMAWAQVTIHTNDCSSATTGWTFNDGGGYPIQQSSYWLLDNTGDYIISQAFNVMSYSNLTLSFKVATYGSGTNHSCKVEYSTDGGTTWNQNFFTSATPTSTTYIDSGTWELGTLNTDQLEFRWTSPSGGGKGIRIDNILFQGVETGASITVSTNTLTGFSYIYGNGPSNERSFIISGSNLSSNIIIDAPTNYEISLTNGELFNAEDPLELTQSGGSVSETTIYVRLKAGLSAGNYNGETITASSSGAPNKIVTCSGTVYKTEPSNHCSNFAVANVTPSTLKLTWTDAAKTTPDGYLIKGSSVSYADIVAPVDGTSESKSTLVRNVNQGVGNYTFTNLAENTTYYFKIYPYTNSGTNINYKTDGEIPQATGTTLINQHLSAGDIAVIGYQSDDPDKFAILLLKAINEGTEVKFTDNGFKDTGTLNTTEGTITWTAPEGGLARGTVVQFTYGSSWTVDEGTITITSSLSFSTSGDQIIVYQGESSNPTFIYALSTTPWVTSGTISTNTSYIPTGLYNGTTCFAFTTEKDDGYYKVTPSTGTPAMVLTSIATETNWEKNDSIIDFPEWDFNIFDYIANEPTIENGLTITIIGGNANVGSGPIPPIPNQNVNFTPLSFVLDNSIANWTITIQPGAAYGAYFQNGNWHTVTGTAEQIIFNITFAKGKGSEEIPIVLGEQDPTLPVELSSFTAVLTSDMYVLIKWIAESETNHSGYNILRAEKKDLDTAQRINAQIIDEGVEAGTQISYSYTDFEAYTNIVYYYWLESVSLDGVSSYYGPSIVTIGDPNQDPRPPEVLMATKLLNAYPNPFNPNTNIRYSLKDAGKVRIDIYNMKGQVIQTLTAEHNIPGFYQLTWDGCDANGKPVASGIYMYRMTSGNYSSAKKMVLAK